ncbi:MAG: cytochrome c maturation protein CcmE [Rhodospirillaceae bacterium]|nr:cytochrome c maturation protein CcmE [Rhodospirillaceae bacterium]MBT5375005.1 cytochrome c maturation protein CcmE [Rhodospirillaceae bacterium]MBT5751241.1 cytochrome c maturation protein CcmE [Rhodospirillaceae bacterium]
MTRKRRRLYIVLIAMGFLFAAGALVLSALRDNLVFFYSPTEILEREIQPGQRIRIGGLVEEASVVQASGEVSVMFRVTDLTQTIPVVFTGVLPDLFREGQGVIAEGSLNEDGVFQATNVLAKHDENYMPPEVAEALKKSGRWQEGAEMNGENGENAAP